jgi:hypothetical protein
MSAPGLRGGLLALSLALAAWSGGDEGGQPSPAPRGGGDQTMSDIAVGIATPSGWQLVSCFDVMTDRLFERYL